MQYRPLGRTGLLVSELCLGTMTFGGRGFWKVVGMLDLPAATGLVERSLAAGVNFIDTADVYGEGESERLLGLALRNLSVRREDVVIATKVRGRSGAGPNDVGLTRKHILASVQASLQRLQTDYIDLYQIHGYDPLTPLEETLRALDNLVSRGLVRYVGCSNLAAWQLMKALGRAEHENLARFESLQAYYSIASRDLERELVPLLQDQGVGLMVWSPLSGGLLSGKFTRGSGGGPPDARRSSFDFPPVDKEHGFAIVEAMRPIAAAHGVSVARVALAWVLQQKPVTSVIIGAKTPEQLDDNLAAADLKLSSEQLAQLDHVSALKSEYPRWMIERQGADREPGARSFAERSSGESQRNEPALEPARALRH
ncbi:MAG TPA: aldo/keto reductase [Steroidobacteraceae bacterium]|jgi:aryl-alcohol dehydrogenase-like predicted oxidoreductase|nr:aldo/keto reductase [Steroidobacteraceae bacterium]